MKKYIFAAFSLILVSAFSDENAETKKPRYHHIYDGIEISGNHFKIWGRDHYGWFPVNGFNIFTGLKLGHEFVKPHSIYSGTEVFVGEGASFIDRNNRRLWGNLTNFAANVEQRLGYTYTLASKTTLSPFLGVGYYYWNRIITSEYWFYASGGFKCNYSATDRFDIGLNFKAMYQFAGDRSNIWSVQVDLPLRWYFGPVKEWYVQVEPYYLKLNLRGETDNFGGRILFGYCF